MNTADALRYLTDNAWRSEMSGRIYEDYLRNKNQKMDVLHIPQRPKAISKHIGEYIHFIEIKG